VNTAAAIARTTLIAALGYPEIGRHHRWLPIRRSSTARADRLSGNTRRLVSARRTAVGCQRRTANRLLLLSSFWCWGC